ncbi:expressed unknown protein [Seminavis robusta]|uniref:Uncharacterized protein n=1 Tax=Seminavis robusta TaxID=568900 RepID=A0A9N8D6J8_9STRA|nr:expressed unknown protein [Seminavis robusta]|eukprot:Sro18_g012680.1 n/a (596) ;mRNA; f:6244-8225
MMSSSMKQSLQRLVPVVLLAAFAIFFGSTLVATKDQPLSNDVNVGTQFGDAMTELSHDFKLAVFELLEHDAKLPMYEARRRILDLEVSTMKQVHRHYMAALLQATVKETMENVSELYEMITTWVHELLSNILILVVDGVTVEHFELHAGELEGSGRAICVVKPNKNSTSCLSLEALTINVPTTNSTITEEEQPAVVEYAPVELKAGGSHGQNDVIKAEQQQVIMESTAAAANVPNDDISSSTSTTTPRTEINVVSPNPLSDEEIFLVGDDRSDGKEPATGAGSSGTSGQDVVPSDKAPSAGTSLSDNPLPNPLSDEEIERMCNIRYGKCYNGFNDIKDNDDRRLAVNVCVNILIEEIVQSQIGCKKYAVGFRDLHVQSNQEKASMAERLEQDKTSMAEEFKQEKASIADGCQNCRDELPKTKEKVVAQDALRAHWESQVQQKDLVMDQLGQGYEKVCNETLGRMKAKADKVNSTLSATISTCQDDFFKANVSASECKTQSEKLSQSLTAATTERDGCNGYVKTLAEEKKAAEANLTSCRAALNQKEEACNAAADEENTQLRNDVDTWKSKFDKRDNDANKLDRSLQGCLRGEEAK